MKRSDLVATYPLHIAAGASLPTFVGNWTDTQVDHADLDIVEAGLTSINHERRLTDVELQYTCTGLPFMAATPVAFGAENVFDRYPRKSRWAPALGNKYPPNSPYGFDGGFYYLRAGVEF